MNYLIIVMLLKSQSESSNRASFAKDSKVSSSANTVDIKDVEYFKCHKKGHYTNKCPDAKEKDGKGFKVGQIEDSSNDKKMKNQSD